MKLIYSSNGKGFDKTKNIMDKEIGREMSKKTTNNIVVISYKRNKMYVYRKGHLFGTWSL